MSPELLAAVETLRRELPEGAEILALASSRARHRVVVRTGRLFDLGLASWTMARPHCDFAEQVGAELAIRRGLVQADELRDAEPCSVLVSDDAEEVAIALCPKRERGPFVILTPTGPARGIDDLCRAFGVRSGGEKPGVVKGLWDKPLELVSTLEKTFLSRADLPEMAPVGLLYVGGADPAEARAQAQAVRAWLAERTRVH